MKKEESLEKCAPPCSLLIFLDILVTAWALQFTMKVQLVLVLCLQLCGSYRLAKGRLHLKFSKKVGNFHDLGLRSGKSND